VTVRSTGWQVQPSFSPHGPTDNVTLLLDEATLTQIAGEDPVAWQTPWEAFSSLRLAQGLFLTALSASIDGRTFLWRTKRRRAFGELAPYVRAAGGSVRKDRGQVAVLLTVLIIVLTSFAGVIGSKVAPPATRSQVAALRALNLTFADLPGAWTSQSPSPLTNVVGTANQLLTSSSATTTTISPTSPFGIIGGRFQSCLHVSAVADRIFGAAGQQPLYQVSSPVYSSTLAGGVQIVSSAQYYVDTSMVARDTAEMQRANFGRCFADANANLTLSGVVASPNVRSGTGLTVHTFAQGFRVAGIAPLNGIATSSGEMERLITVVVTSGHYEVTLLVLAPSYRAVGSLVASVTDILATRVSPSSGSAV